MTGVFISPGTSVAIVVGIAISVSYLWLMAKALQKAAATIDTPEADGQDAFSFSFVGAVVAVIASSLAIWSYGMSPICLYIGIVLAFLSPIAVTYTFLREVRD